MQKGRPKGQPKTGGRQKGSLNKATAEVKTLAQQYGKESIDTLAKIMKEGESDASKIAAAKELLDRGYGKSTQAITGADGAPFMPPVVQFVLDADKTDEAAT